MSCRLACYLLLLEFPQALLKQYSVMNTVIFNLKHCLPDPTGTSFPVVPLAAVFSEKKTNDKTYQGQI